LKSGDKRTITIRSTHRGPIVSDIHPDAKGQSKAISFKWTEFDAFDETTALFMLAKATNWDEFSEASSYLERLDKIGLMQTRMGILDGGLAPKFQLDWEGRN
jgi:acyl-homoserine lactone acylase PvdQ